MRIADCPLGRTHHRSIRKTNPATGVILGLVPRIQLSAASAASGWMDGRAKTDHDNMSTRKLKALCAVNWVPAFAGMTFVGRGPLSTGVMPAEAGT